MIQCVITLHNTLLRILYQDGKSVPRHLVYSFITSKYDFRSRDSSGSIVSDYGLDDRAIGVRFPAEAKHFSSILCPDRLCGPPSLLYNGYRGSFPGGKARPGRDAEHSPPCSAEVVNE
jgi:hypothetical protein